MSQKLVTFGTPTSAKLVTSLKLCLYLSTKDTSAAIRIEVEQAKRLCERLTLLDAQIKELKQTIPKECKADKDIQRPQTIPGVGDKTTLAFAAYVGDGKRFNNGDEAANYLGLVPWVNCSGTINRYGHITKKGNRIVRALLYQAAWSIVRSKLRKSVKGKILLYDGARGRRYQ